MAGSNGAKKMIETIISTLVKEQGFDSITLSKLAIVSAGDGKCVASLKVDDEHVNRAGTLHGGLTATLVDSVTTLAHMTLPDAAPGVSVDLNVSYMKAAKTGDEILIKAETLKSGKVLAFLSADIVNKDTGAIIAQGKHTKYIA